MTSKTKKAPTRQPADDQLSAVQHDDLFQVVLFNDDHNAMEYVVLCLMRVFKHTIELATKIMLEAHVRGRAIAEVEAQTQALKHKKQLATLGIMTTVEKI